MSQARIIELEEEVESLKQQLESSKCSGWDDDDSSRSDSSADEIVEFLSKHKSDLTLDFLENLLKTFTDIRRRQPDKNFEQILEDLTTKADKGDSDIRLVQMTKELEKLRATSDNIESKFQLAKKRFEEDLIFLTDVNADQLQKSHAAREYMDRLADRKRVNDDLVERFKLELADRDKEIADLSDRCQAAEKQSQEYLKAWKDAQRMTRQGHDTSNLFMHNQRNHHDRSVNHRLMVNASPAHSFDESNQIPSPPPVEEPQLEEILQGLNFDVNQTGHSAMNNVSENPYSSMMSFNGIDEAIPPPPEQPMDEILKELHSSPGSSLSFNCNKLM